MSGMDYRDFVERARQRGRDERHQARWRGGTLTVKSESTPGETYEQHFELTPWSALWFHCTCPSGVNRPHLLTPCKHTVRWAERMVRELGDVRVFDGVYFYDNATPTAAERAASISFAADTCARRELDRLRRARRAGVVLNPKELERMRRLEELVARLDDLARR